MRRSEKLCHPLHENWLQNSSGEMFFFVCDCSHHVLIDVKIDLMVSITLTEVSSNEPYCQSSGDRRDSFLICQTIAAGLALSACYLLCPLSMIFLL